MAVEYECDSLINIDAKTIRFLNMLTRKGLICF